MCSLGARCRRRARRYGPARTGVPGRVLLQHREPAYQRRIAGVREDSERRAGEAKLSAGRPQLPALFGDLRADPLDLSHVAVPKGGFRTTPGHHVESVERQLMCNDGLVPGMRSLKPALEHP